MSERSEPICLNGPANLQRLMAEVLELREELAILEKIVSKSENERNASASVEWHQEHDAAQGE